MWITFWEFCTCQWELQSYFDVWAKLSQAISSMNVFPVKFQIYDSICMTQNAASVHEPITTWAWRAVKCDGEVCLEHTVCKKVWRIEVSFSLRAVSCQCHYPDRLLSTNRAAVSVCLFPWWLVIYKARQQAHKWVLYNRLTSLLASQVALATLASVASSSCLQTADSQLDISARVVFTAAFTFSCGSLRPETSSDFKPVAFNFL